LFLGMTLQCFCSWGQEESYVKLKFKPKLEKMPLELGKTFYLNGNADSIVFSVFRFYVSGIQLLLNKEVAWKDTPRLYLLDAENEKSYSIPLKIPENLIFNEINFLSGIDSTTNVSGAFGGDLDPTNGMYWTWQNGYINAKFEGKSNLCKSRDASFELHLGGYQFPYNALQSVQLKLTSKKIIEVHLELDHFINNIDIAEKHHIMSPCNEAVLMSKAFSNSFKIAQ
jgi:hypothetical protein